MSCYRENISDSYIKAIINLSGVKANEPGKILAGIAHYENPEEVIAFTESEIRRYTTSYFSKAWFYEEVRRLAKACLSCQFFHGRYGDCENKDASGCQLQPEKAFYNQKTVAQEVAEELDIPYFKV